MSDFIIIDGDMANFLPAFGAAIVIPVPGPIKGSAAKLTITGKKACIKGDETSVEVQGCVYTSGPYSIPGTGTLKIDKLAPDQLAKKATDGGTEVVLKGIQFDAIFEVMAPAMMPPPANTSDSMTKYPGGKGMFVNSNVLVKAT